MLNPNLIRENPEKIKQGIVGKGYSAISVEEWISIDKKRRELIVKRDKLLSERNKLTKTEIDRGREIKRKLQEIEPEFKKIKEKWEELLYEISNPPAADVPFGKSENENIELKKWREPKKFGFPIKDFQEIAENLDLIDVKRASKVSGTRFGYLKNQAVLLELALVDLAIKTLTKEGFIPVLPPVLINKSITQGLGYWQGKGEEDYYLTSDFYLAGTAEHAIVPMHKDEIFEAKDLPRRYVGFSTCFRQEAGSYGKDTRGIFRVHQFDKVEMVSFIEPQENSDEKENNYLLSLAEKLVQTLEIPYQVTKMCTGDLGFPAARKYDLNCWFPSEGKYRETHSISTCTDFQARRLNIKYKKEGKTDFVHILNGTALAIGRMILAILENYQQKDGSIKIPKALQDFVGKEIIKKI